MNKSTQLALVFLFLSSNIFAQNLLNGDLEGVISGFSTLPPNWQIVDYYDVNCQADPGGTTPDLVDPTQPSVSIGAIGTPYSGDTFVAGSHGVSATSGTVFQEGIQQEVTDFIIGQLYQVSFYQSVVKNSQGIDTSGSWLVILDDSVIDITIPTVSQEPYNSLSFSWEFRSLLFTASANTHTLKFLPLDDDEDMVSSPTNVNGSLYMGIDSINIVPVLISGIQESDPLEFVTVHPNPAKDFFFVDILNNSIGGRLTLYSSFGVKLMSKNLESGNNQIDISSFPNGSYFILIESDSKVVTKSILKQ